MQIIEKAGAQVSASPFSFVLSTGDVDRMGDVVVQNGISLAGFKRNPVALFAHQSRMPIGTWENIRRDGDQLLADLKLAARGTSRLVDELRSLIEQKILRAASIGFGVVKAEPLDPEKPYGGVRFLKTELLEASLVAVPANQNALALRSLSAEARAMFFAEDPGNSPATVPATDAHASSQSRAATQGHPRMNIAERVKAARARLVEIDKRVGELQAVAESVDNLSTEHTAEVETLTAERATVEKNIDGLVKLETLIATRAEPVSESRAVVTRAARTAHADEPKGTLLARMGLAHVYARLEQRSLADVVRERFGHDQRIEAIFKSAVNVADTTTAGWAAELVRVDVQGFIDMLAPVSCYAAMSQRGLVIDFGNAGSVSLPYRAGTNTDAAGAFVGENGVIPVKRATLGANQMARYKMGVITTLTKELARASTPQAEALLRRFMSDDTAVALDHAFLDSTPLVPGIRPPGIKYGIAAIPASVAANPIDRAIADLKALVNAMVAANNGVRPVFLMNPAQKLALSMIYSSGLFVFRDELSQGKLMGGDVVTSANITAGEVILVDAANFATGLGTPEFDASDTATLVMANSDGTIPTHATQTGDRTAFGVAERVPPDGGISVFDPLQHAAGKVGEGALAISMFQQWTIALRTVLPVSWSLTRAGSVQWIAAVTW